jgi:hypothetical protein
MEGTAGYTIVYSPTGAAYGLVARAAYAGHPVDTSDHRLRPPDQLCSGCGEYVSATGVVMRLPGEPAPGQQAHMHPGGCLTFTPVAGRPGQWTSIYD